MRRPKRHRMLPATKKLKRRIVLSLMAVCGVTMGVLCVLGKARRDGGVGSARVDTRDGAVLAGLGVAEVGARAGGGEGEAIGQATERALSSSDCSTDVSGGGVAALYIVMILYCFLGLAIVCDEFFQTSLEIISEVLGLTPDVAGATFLAAGSSAPELFTSLADAFGDANSTGTGTIVGSAMFNILVIVALSAAVAGKNGSSIHIDWRPVCRDVTFYSYSVLLLTLVFLDSEVQWWEGLIMTSSYAIYITFMKYNTRILSHCLPPKIGIEDQPQPSSKDVAAAVAMLSAAKRPSHGAGVALDPAKVAPLPQDDKSIPAVTAAGSEDAAAVAAAEGAAAAISGGSDAQPTRKSATLGIRHRVERRLSGGGMSSMDLGVDGSDRARLQEDKPLILADQNQATADEENGPGATVKTEAGTGGGLESGKPEKDEKAGEGAGEEEEVESRFMWPDSSVDKVLYVVGLPLLIVLSLTIPDSSNPRFRKYYIVSFIASLMWIGLLTHYMVVGANAVGCYAGVSPIFMGLVVLAIGTSVPDALGSMIAARSGEANMAIANAVGSNVFDVLIGLGFPWFLRGLIKSEPMPVDVDGIAINVIILFCTGLLFVVVLAVNDWSMNTKTGIFLFGLYLAYVVLVVIQELVLE